MRNHISHALIMLAASLSVISCDFFFDIVLPTDPSVFVINQNSERVEVGPEAMEHSVYIASDMTWNAILLEGTWCRLKQQTYFNEFTSTLIFEVDANTSAESRTDSLIVASGAQRKSIAIIQYGTEGVMDASEIVLSGTKPVQYLFRASGQWTAEKTGDWFTVSPTSGNGNTVLTFKALDKNEKLEERTGRVCFSMNGVNVEIPVRQLVSENPLLGNTNPGFYGIQGSDYIYRKTTSQASRFSDGDSRSFRLIFPDEGCALQVQGIPPEPEVDTSLPLTVSVYKGGQTFYSQPITGTIIGMDANLIWLKCSDITYFILKK